MKDITYDINDKDIKWIQKEYQTRFGVVLDNDEAHRKLHLLVRQMELTYRPITKKQLEKLNENEENNELLKLQLR